MSWACLWPHQLALTISIVDAAAVGTHMAPTANVQQKCSESVKNLAEAQYHGRGCGCTSLGLKKSM